MSENETEGPSRQGGLLIVWHSRTGGSKSMARAARQGADGQDMARPATMLQACDTTPDDVLAAGALLFVCPENLAAVSGEMKEFFDRCYYPLLGRIEGRPYATAIAAGSDGENATRQIDRIATGWRLRRVAEPVICNLDAQSPKEILAPKTLSASDARLCRELGAALAAGLSMGVF